MRIVCPSCEAAYELPPTLLKPGQAVRCARCQREWLPPGDEPSPVPPAPTAIPVPPAPTAIPGPPPVPDNASPLSRLATETHLAAGRRTTTTMENLARPGTPPRNGHGVGIAWFVSLVVLALLVWGAYVGRATVMQVWPPSIRLYSALNLVAEH
jgi:predicted Zn finger-like uncharacterized protein